MFIVVWFLFYHIPSAVGSRCSQEGNCVHKASTHFKWSGKTKKSLFQSWKPRNSQYLSTDVSGSDYDAAAADDDEYYTTESESDYYYYHSPASDVYYSDEVYDPAYDPASDTVYDAAYDTAYEGQSSEDAPPTQHGPYYYTDGTHHSHHYYYYYPESADDDDSMPADAAFDANSADSSDVADSSVSYDSAGDSGEGDSNETASVVSAVSPSRILSASVESVGSGAGHVTGYTLSLMALVLIVLSTMIVSIVIFEVLRRLCQGSDLRSICRGCCKSLQSAPASVASQWNYRFSGFSGFRYQAAQKHCELNITEAEAEATDRKSVV